MVEKKKNKGVKGRKKVELKEAIKIELSQRRSQYSPSIKANIQVLGARKSTKGSNAETAVNPSGEEHVAHVMLTMGLYVQGDHCTHLVALGKIYEGGSTIHGMTYADDMVRVRVEFFFAVMLKSRCQCQKFSMSGQPLTHSFHGRHML